MLVILSFVDTRHKRARTKSHLNTANTLTLQIKLCIPRPCEDMSFSFVSEEEEEFEKDIFKQRMSDATGIDETSCEKEVIILGGKLLCSDVYSLMAKAPGELHHIEIQTDLETEKFTDVFNDKNRALTGRKLKKSRSFVQEQKQRRKREKTQKLSSSEKSKEHTRDSVLSKKEFNELSVLTESFDTLARTDYLKTRFPPIFQESKSLLKRKKEEQKLQTATKEFLPALNIKVNLNEKIVRQTQGSTNLPTLIHKQGLTVKAPPPSPESLSPTPSPTKTDATFSEASPVIPRKKPPKSYEDDTPPSPRRPTPFPSIWGEDRFFITSFGSNVMSEKAKTYLVKEEQE